MVEARYKGPIDLSQLEADKLPEKIGLVTTVQFLDYVNEIINFLESHNKIVFTDKQRQKYDAQLLGCDQGAAIKTDDKVDAFLYIGTGKFHPLGVALRTTKEVYCYDPIHAINYKISQKEVEEYSKHRKGAYLKFLASKEIGVLVSIKPGQNNFRKAIELKEKIKDKNFYIFAFDTLDFNQIENFPFIGCWVNTACNRILDDYGKFPKPLIDLADLDNEVLVVNLNK